MRRHGVPWWSLSLQDVLLPPARDHLWGAHLHVYGLCICTDSPWYHVGLIGMCLREQWAIYDPHYGWTLPSQLGDEMLVHYRAVLAAVLPLLLVRFWSGFYRCRYRGAAWEIDYEP